MSRAYRNETHVDLGRTPTERDRLVAINAYRAEWHYEGSDVIDTEILLWGDGSLCGGESEEEAHARITRRVRKHFPKTQVATDWTYLDELPFETYVTEADEDPQGDA